MQLRHRCTVLVLILWFSTSIVDAQENAEGVVNRSAPPPPVSTIETADLSLDLFFDSIQQGRAALIRLRGDNLTSARANVFNQQFDFFTVPDDNNLYALLVARIEQPIRRYEMIVTVQIEGENQPIEMRATLDVVSGQFIQQDVLLVGNEDLESLLDLAIEEAELAQIFNITQAVTPDVLWESGGFQTPIEAELTSPFGAVRVFNDTLETLHTGWDFQAAIGQPIRATAGGRIAFAGPMRIRGNYVIIDHGQGVYSGYAHLSVIHVTQGQRVSGGQIIGRVGSTGRSSSAHAHVEFIVHNEWVDTAEFIQMYIP